MNEIKNFCSPEMADLFEKQLNEEANENKNHTSVVEINAELKAQIVTIMTNKIKLKMLMFTFWPNSREK